jgi:ubiquinone biosynthesis protein COQ9
MHVIGVHLDFNYYSTEQLLLILYSSVHIVLLPSESTTFGTLKTRELALAASTTCHWYMI